MSERPAPITRTDEILLHLVDRVDALSDALVGRGGAPAQSGTPKPAAKKTAAKKTTATGKKSVAVDGT